MNNPARWCVSLLVVMALGSPIVTRAQTVTSVGGGTAVLSVDRSTSFHALDVDGIPLTDFQDGGLLVTTEGDSYVGVGLTIPFDPFHGASNGDAAFYFPFTNGGGNHDWVTIQTTDGLRIYGVEFMYGNGWTTGQIYGPYPWGNNAAVLEWQTWNGPTLSWSGVLGAGPILDMGTIVGFSDISGFDRLRLRCTIATSGDTAYQALAMDSLRVSLVSPVGVGRGNVPSAAGLRLSVTPNPTAGPATFAFVLPATGRAQLRVHDLAGRLIGTLVDDVRPDGAGIATWDGLGPDGRRVGCGVYFARLTTGGRSDVRRFCVTR